MQPQATQWPSGLRLALLEHDSAMQRVLSRRLDDAGWEYRWLPQPPSARALVMMRLHALVLDLDLLDASRWAYLEEVAGVLPELPIVVCTRPWPVPARVRALRAGAQDWISKPCHPDELLARVQAAVRSRRGHPAPQPLNVGELMIDPRRRVATATGQDLELTPREFALLQLLAEAEGEVLERSFIYRRVWGYEMAHGDRSVDVYVRKLRQKLERAGHGRYVHTHFGVGYRLAVERDVAPAEAEAVVTPLP